MLYTIILRWRKRGYDYPDLLYLVFSRGDIKTQIVIVRVEELDAN